MDCPNCRGDGSIIIGEMDPQRDHPATCPECKGRRKVPDTPGVRLCRAFHDCETDAQDTEADNVYINARSYWDRMAEAAEYLYQPDTQPAQEKP
jgi:DnaJ-class molecular chaperone